MANNGGKRNVQMRKLSFLGFGVSQLCYTYAWSGCLFLSNGDLSQILQYCSAHQILNIFIIYVILRYFHGKGKCTVNSSIKENVSMGGV